MNDLVPLSVLALELPETTPDELAARLSDEIVIADELGRRSVPTRVAREMIEAEARRRYERAEGERKRRAEARERYREIQRKHAVPPGVKRVIPAGMSTAAVMVAADGHPMYDGGTYTPRPTHLDWVFGNAEGGGTIGPSAEEIKRRGKKRP